MANTVGDRQIVEDRTDVDVEQAVGTKKVEKRLSFLDLYKVRPIKPRKDYPISETLLLAYQSLGIVYGDLGTSPLYTFPAVRLPNPREDDILGILSIILWSLTLICVVKYVCIVLRADDHGEGGTFAIYSLLSRHLNLRNNKISQTSRLDSDANLRYYSSSVFQTKAKKLLEESKTAQSVLTFIVLLGICMVIGDGALTPAISVLSAVQGIQLRTTKIHQGHVVIMSVIILLFVFLFQRMGTTKVSFTFSPIMFTWLLCTAGIGVFNIIKHYPAILKAVSPHYIVKLFLKDPKTAWKLLGSTALCLTGAEAMFADLGHFNKRSIQVAFIGFVYPALVLTYSGEAAYLIKNPQDMSTAFYSAVPKPIFWPVFIIATLAAVVGSQCLISASFSIIKQAMALGCFPRVTMIHTSDKYEGQVYSPEVNYFVMVICLLIVICFKGGAEIGNAYGAAVILVMLITTWLMLVVMIAIWDTHFLLILLFLGVFFMVEGAYMTSLLNKIPQGAWVPFAISFFVLFIIYSWRYGRRKKSEYEAKRKLSLDELTELISQTGDQATRVPGICFFCTDLVNGVPPIIRHYVQLLGSLRQVMVIVTVRTLPVKSVLPTERFLVARLGPKGVYRCLVQYGYKDEPNMEGEDFVQVVVELLKEVEMERAEEIAVIESALNNGGVMFVMGRTILKCKETNSWLCRFAIDCLYRFLQKNCRPTMASLRVPPSKMLQVGMLYEI
ncbi:potassium transporter 26-like [Aristolochia californica]|uniref:potassium transporter 26-like n=1 Tax=Aristolochia californica TaxID=171875 RepID=UPI0035D7211E